MFDFFIPVQMKEISAQSRLHEYSAVFFITAISIIFKKAINTRFPKVGRRNIKKIWSKWTD